MNLAAWSGVFGTWISVAAGATGGYAALQTYNEEVAKMEDARVVQTFALFEMFNNADLLQARQRVLDAANSGEPVVGHDLWMTLDFYDALEICVQRNLCDQDLAVRIFQPYAVPIWSGLNDVIVGGRSESDPNMGGGLEWMARLPPPGSPRAEASHGAASDYHNPDFPSEYHCRFLTSVTATQESSSQRNAAKRRERKCHDSTRLRLSRHQRFRSRVRLL
jgi:hypothetical protein